MNGRFEEDKYVDILNYAVGLKRNGDYKSSIQLTKEAIKIDPYREIAYNNLGKLLHITGNYLESAKSYRKAFEFGWNPKQAVRHLGHSLVANEITDEKDVILHMIYRSTIDPYFERRLSSHDKYKLEKKVTKTDYERYEDKCIRVGIEYMNSLIGGPDENS